MKVRNIASLALLIGLAPCLASAAGSRPLQLELPALSTTTAPAIPRATRPLFASRAADRPARVEPLFRRTGAGRRSAGDNRAELEARVQHLGRQALESVLDPASEPAPALDEQRGEGRLQLKFQKRGNAFRDLGRSYREMCDSVSAKLWDDPNGKRVRFDVAGKPGVGVEIPIGHKR